MRTGSCLLLLASLLLALASCAGDEEPSVSPTNEGDLLYEGDDPGECSDGADNDRDGAFDCDDDQCAASPVCTNPPDNNNVTDSDMGGRPAEDLAPQPEDLTEDRDLGGEPDLEAPDLPPDEPDMGAPDLTEHDLEDEPDMDTSDLPPDEPDMAIDPDVIEDEPDIGEPGPGRFGSLSLTYRQRVDFVGQFSDTTCATFGLCDCENVFSGQGLWHAESGAMVTFEGSWALSETDCAQNLRDLSWVPGDGASFHTLHFAANNALVLEAWVAHANEGARQPLSPPMRQFHITAMSAPLDTNTWMIHHEEVQEERADPFAQSDIHHTLDITLTP